MYNLYSLPILQRYFGIYSYIIHTLRCHLCYLREQDVETRETELEQLNIGECAHEFYLKQKTPHVRIGGEA